MLRRKTGCFTMGITVLVSDTDLEASTKKKKDQEELDENQTH